MRKRIAAAGLTIVLILGLIVGAGRQIAEEPEKEIKEFTAFFTTPGEEKHTDNEIQNLIAQKIGAKCTEYWLNGQTADEAIASYIASGEYPDFISANVTLYEAGALIPLDEYWEDYPNIRGYMSDVDWDKFRQEDGHIYWMPQFGVVKEPAEDFIHEGEAFWIQTRVLKWAGYPKITTVEAYFDLLEAYMEANPSMPDLTGQGETVRNIPFTILCDDWRYFCLENPPQFLDGYPNDGSVMVDPSTQKVMDYSMTPTAKAYFAKLNEEYHKGIIDPESFTQTYDEYIDKLATGRVLGMVDQWWQFTYEIDDSLKYMTELGCNYVPLPITMEEGVHNQWHVTRGSEVSIADGIAITTSCDDIAGAMQFLNDLLDPEIRLLRYWGIEGVDYEVDENGVFYRTSEQRKNALDHEYVEEHYCIYSYFPRIEGLCEDGINSFSPEYQKGEFFDALASDVRECLQAYDCMSYVDMLGSNESPGPWFPMYSYSDLLTPETEAGAAWDNMGKVKHTYLPQVIMSDDFESTWQEYMTQYENCHPEAFLAEMQRELERRISSAKHAIL